MKYKITSIRHFPAHTMRDEAYQRLRVLGASRGQAERFISRYVDGYVYPSVSYKGGSTMVTIEVCDHWFVGHAYCSPEDVYVPKIGRKIALQRAIAAARVHGFFEPLGCTNN